MKISFLTKWTAGIMVCTALLALPAAAQQTPKLSDAEIASIAVTANQIDINYANLAMQKTKNPEVLRFAQTMATDHKAVIDKAVALVTKLGVTPKDNDVSKSLQSDAEKTGKSLRAKDGDAFTKAYIDNEVAYHKAVINTVENVLIPQSQNAELKALLQSVMPVLRAHLEHAHMVQGQLGK
jgi:putative membrane protein